MKERGIYLQTPKIETPLRWMICARCGEAFGDEPIRLLTSKTWASTGGLGFEPVCGIHTISGWVAHSQRAMGTGNVVCAHRPDLWPGAIHDGCWIRDMTEHYSYLNPTMHQVANAICKRDAKYGA